ncbi:MAG: ArsR/SmtB family transcription factor [Nannocystaceae bacterium]|nr:metalloregulator ArsR/SmtB family transcription factor [bacterium]
MTKCFEGLDATFRALGDPTRRALLSRLARGPATVSELAEPFEMAMPSLMLHLRKLEEAGLIGSKKRGRVRTCFAELSHLDDAVTWLTSHQQLWQRRLDRLEAFLDDDA